ncbi:MAG: hypothetical protein IJ367_04295, partial [Clostridia bacterium]|nr:hypothetical protein [Clostridia bacterium]
MKPNIVIQPYDSQTQKKVFDIFYAQFSEQIETDNCFLLADVGQKITKALNEIGFSGAKATLFRACPEYFIYGYDSSKRTPSYPANALAVVGYKTPERFVKWNAEAPVQKLNLIKVLKKQFPYNEVPLLEIEAFLKKQPVSFTDIHQLLAEQAPAMEIKELSLGEGHPSEEFLVVHKPNDIPENIRNRVIWAVKQNFPKEPIVKNTELGKAFRKLNVHFKDYGYLHITSFIRHFFNIFSIISVSKGERNQV